MRPQCRSGHDSNVLATGAAEHIALVGCTETTRAVYELLTGAPRSRQRVAGTTLIAVEQRPKAFCRFEDPVEESFTPSKTTQVVFVQVGNGRADTPGLQQFGRLPAR